MTNKAHALCITGGKLQIERHEHKMAFHLSN